jgi:hypothetical protein
VSVLAMDPEKKKRLRAKNLALLGALVAVIVILYALAMIRISAQL